MLLRHCCWCGRGFYKVACCFDSVASTLLLVWTGLKILSFRQCQMLLRHCCRFGNNVVGFGINVERNFVLSTKSKQIEHVQFVSTLSKGRNFVRLCCRKRQHCCQKRLQCRSNIGHCRKNRSTCSVRQCCFDIVASMDGALDETRRGIASHSSTVVW